MEKYQKRVEALEKELVGSTAALLLAESSLANSSKAAKVAEARAVAALSCLTASDMKLEVLRSKVAEKEVEMRDVVEKLKDAVFEEVEVIYLEQVKTPVFKQSYDVGLGVAGVPEDSPL